MIKHHHEYILSKQLLRSGTSVAAMIREAEHAESRKDFKHKLSIAQKEMNETLYWLELLAATDFISSDQFQSLYGDGEQVMRLVTAILKSTKLNDEL